MTIINGIEIDNIRYTNNEIKKAILNNDPIEDKLHVIMVISNPCNYAIRYILAKEFIRRMKEEEHVILYIVELAYGNQEHHITESNNERHLQLRTDQIPIWHKENMINIGVKKLLPPTWKAFAWIDADLEFDSPSWALDTLKILNGSKDIVQLFSNVLFLDENGDTEIIFTSFGYKYLKESKQNNDSNLLSYWHPGFAWACTRKLYEKIGGLYEYAITGDGDGYMVYCLSSLPRSEILSNDFKESLQTFENKIIGSRIGYVPGIVQHHFHGTFKNRHYDQRQKMLLKYNYSPTEHLTKDKNGLLIPTDKFPIELKNSILNHFQSKNEDNIIKNSINLVNILEEKFKKSLNLNCILINLKKDIGRLASCKEEFKKIFDISYNQSIKCLDAIYWKDIQFENDVNSIFTFLRQFNQNISLDRIIINEFSEISDPNIKIQGGPLACYCSHIKSMIHGYFNFNDYTIICEDDISIDNIGNIEKYINLIPDDWDIIIANGEPQNIKYNSPFYKFKDSFYHLHFYIIKNKCFETIFQNLYPVTDQIDILIGNMHDKLNIYNITDTINQKQFITNIQNNLHIIYNTPIYSKLVKELNLLETLCYSYVNDILLNNDEQINKNISSRIIEDVIYVNIFNYLDTNYSNTPIYTQNKNKLYRQIQKILLYYIKDPNYVNINNNRFNNLPIEDVITDYEDSMTCNFASKLMNDINYILDQFTLHNHNGYKAYNFGSTSSVYFIKDTNSIIKIYNDKLRWSMKGHDNINDIYNKEISIMIKIDPVSKLISYDIDELSITMEYQGESLYTMFSLPDDWELQICNLFNMLSVNNIYYPEFNLNNIVVLNNVISFIDFGLAEIIDNPDNTNNCNVFIKLLHLLNDKYKSVDNRTQQHILYNTFMTNIKNKKLYPLNVF
jgi:hypothetical protein